MAIAGSEERYLKSRLTAPIATKDGGTLRTVQDAWGYVGAISAERETRSHWQKVRQMILVKADVAAVSWQIRLALLKDAKLGAENG